jgi:hypothetical protein
MSATLYFRTVSVSLWHNISQLFSLKDAGRGVTPGDSLVEGGGTSPPLLLTETIGTGAGSTLGTTTVAGMTAGRLLPTETNPRFFITAPLAADVTIIGTVSFDVYAHESSMNANATVRVALYRVDEQGGLTLIVDSSFGTELGTSKALKSWTASPTSTAMKRGDRFAALVLWDDAGAITMGNGFTCTFTFGGENADASDSRISFTETPTFITADPSGSTYYLRDTASDISGGKVLSTVQGSGTVEAVHTTLTGPLTFPGDQWTLTAGGSDAEWFTPALDAFTLQDVVLAEVRNRGTLLADRLENSASPFDTLVLELAVVDADGTNPVVWARSYTSTTDTADPKKHYLTGPALAVGQGKRLRFRPFSDDFRPSGDQVSGTDRTIRYDGTSTYATRLIFTQTITEASGVSYVDGAWSATGIGVASVIASALRNAAVSALGTGSLTTDAQRLQSTSVSYTGIGTAALAGQRLALGAATWAGTGTAAFNASALRNAAVTYTGTGTHALAGSIRTGAVASWTGIGTLTVASQAMRSTSWSAAGVGAWSATGLRVQSTTWSGLGTGTSALTGTRVQSGIWSALGVGLFTATADQGGAFVDAIWTAAGTGTLTTTGQRVQSTTWSGTGVGAFSAAAVRVQSLTWSATGVGLFSATAGLLQSAAWSGLGTGTWTTIAVRVQSSAWSALGIGLWSATPSAIRTATWSAAGVGTWSASALRLQSDSWSGFGTGTFTPAGLRVQSTSWSALGILTSRIEADQGVNFVDGVVTWTGTGTVAVVGSYIAAGSAAWLGQGTFLTIAGVLQSAAWTSTGIGTATWSGIRVADAAWTGLGIGIFSITAEATSYVDGVWSGIGVGVASFTASQLASAQVSWIGIGLFDILPVTGISIPRVIITVGSSLQPVYARDLPLRSTYDQALLLSPEQAGGDTLTLKEP